MIRVISILLLLTLFISCKTANKVSNPAPVKEAMIVFEKYTAVSEDGKKQVDILFDEIINKAASDSNQTYSKAEILLFKNMVLADMFNTKKSEVTIKVQNDSIWRYQKQDGLYIEYNRIEKNNGWLHFYNYPNTSIEIRPSFDLFQKNIDCSIEILKNVRKKVLGYDCYKVILIPKIERINADIPLGDKIYEMYVTEQIELPTHTLINIGKLFSFFPLEVVSFDSNLKGLKEIHKVVKIEVH